jgi:hypothetical protein
MKILKGKAKILNNGSIEAMHDVHRTEKSHRRGRRTGKGLKYKNRKDRIGEARHRRRLKGLGVIKKVDLEERPKSNKPSKR